MISHHLLFKRFTSHIDWPLLLSIIALSTLGMLVLYSAKQDVLFLSNQLVRFTFAFLLMLGVAQIPPHYFRYGSYWLYGIGLLLLVLVLGMGSMSKGAQRWLDLWIIRFQPAELMKLAVPMTIARYLESSPLPPKGSVLLFSSFLILLPGVLIAKQPDLGTAILIVTSGSLVIFLAGISWKMVTKLGVATLLTMPFLWFVMHDYQKKRVFTLLHPEQDPLGSGYHIIQSKIALGSGGILGKGWFNGSQANLEFLPEKTTDFIFAVFGEAFGFIGTLPLLALYLFIVLRGLSISVQAQDTFTRLLAGSLALTFFIYVFVNISMVTGILPVVGIPLPLMSYGGTSLVTIMLSFGILMSIQTNRRLLAK